MSRHHLLVLSLAASACLAASAVAGQELSQGEKTLSTELQRCPAQNAEACHKAALQQFETSLRRDFPTPNATYWGKVFATLKRHARQLDAEMQAASKQKAGANPGRTLEACINAGGTRAECLYWIVVLGGGR